MKDIGQGQEYIDFTERNRIYIDKTAQIFNLLKYDRVFFSRPRRFGKSLVLDTINTLFEKGVDPYFKNTWIYEHWNDRQYLVLKLDFLSMSCRDYNKFCKDFDDQIAEFTELNDLEYSSKDFPNQSIKSLFKTLKKAKKQIKIVILIDEYDAQLSANINNPELYEIFRASLQELYGVFKASTSIRFLGITGVTRLKDVSIFSAGSDIKDLSYDHSISTITGFTREEIRTNYIDHINLAISLSKGILEQQITEEQREELLDQLAEEYDGYCFDEDYINKVYSTWSVNSFFLKVSINKKVKFQDYWYDNGGMPLILARYLEKHTIKLEDYAEDLKVSIADFWNPATLLNMVQEVLMCQTGYLTVHSKVPNGNKVTLGFPNKEVQRALEKVIATNLFPTADLSQDDFEKIFSEGTVPDIVGKLNSLMKTISYDEYQQATERTIQGFIHAFMVGADQNVLTERHNAFGRSDIEIEYDKRRLVLELKYAKNVGECNNKLQEAIKQMQDQSYGDVQPNKEVLKIALVFNGDKSVRQFTHFKVVD